MREQFVVQQIDARLHRLLLLMIAYNYIFICLQEFVYTHELYVKQLYRMYVLDNTQRSILNR